MHLVTDLVKLNKVFKRPTYPLVSVNYVLNSLETKAKFYVTLGASDDTCRPRKARNPRPWSRLNGGAVTT